jgi:hypothetical protein
MTRVQILLPTLLAGIVFPMPSRAADWEDVMEDTYGDNWEEMIENRYGDNWEDLADQYYGEDWRDRLEDYAENRQDARQYDRRGDYRDNRRSDYRDDRRGDYRTDRRRRAQRSPYGEPGTAGYRSPYGGTYRYGQRDPFAGRIAPDYSYYGNYYNPYGDHAPYGTGYYDRGNGYYDPYRSDRRFDRFNRRYGSGTYNTERYSLYNNTWPDRRSRYDGSDRLHNPYGNGQVHDPYGDSYGYYQRR